jgi:predicted nucleic acid-binding protein
VSGFLLDTNVVSELVKPRPEPTVVHWIQATEESLLFLSVLTIGEIRKVISSLPSGNRRALLESWLGNDLVMRFADRILSIDFEIAERWGLLSAQAKSSGVLLPVIDGLLAATALHHNLTFVTRNASDVKLAGLSVFNPWMRAS